MCEKTEELCMLHLGVELDPRTFDYIYVCVRVRIEIDYRKAGGWGWFEDRSIFVVLLRSYDRVK